MTRQAKHFYEFGPFCLDLGEHLLLRDGQAVPVPPKVFDILLFMVQNSGHLLGKDEMIKAVWPDAFVEEGNLTRYVSTLRKALGEGGENSYIETVPRLGYRFVAQVRERREGGEESSGAGGGESIAAVAVQGLLPYPDGEEASGAALSAESVAGQNKARGRGMRWALAALLIATAPVFGFLGFSIRRAPALTDKDTILLGDFVNTTGDPVFDETLKQALAVQLEQSPFLNLLSDERVRETLRLMNRPLGERVAGATAREICERQNLKALFTGSIASLGRHYVITLEATRGGTGEVVARQQVEAESKEQVLGALGKVASRMRVGLGESLQSIRRFDTPIEQATTPSLEALRAYSLGLQQSRRSRWVEAIPFLKRAVELDPDFAIAYAELALACVNAPQPKAASGFASKAFELRERASEREKFEITHRYYQSVKGASGQALEVLELWRQTYPSDVRPQEALANHYLRVGEPEKCLEIMRQLVRLDPDYGGSYSTIAIALMHFNQYAEAKAVIEQAMARQIDWRSTRTYLYLIAFIQGDTAAMRQHIDWAAGRPYDYDALIWPANTAAFGGRLRQARELYRQAIELAERRQEHKLAERLTTIAMVWEAALGSCPRSVNSDPQTLIAEERYPTSRAYALALCGEIDQAQALADKLAKESPENVVRNTLNLPMIQAAIELHRGHPSRTIQLLQPLSRYEGTGVTGLEGGTVNGFWPFYLCGQAYLRLRAGTEAGTEFQKILDHRGWKPDAVLYPLAHLGLARAAALASDVTRSRRAYQDFFKLWQDADADLPILIKAKKEYEKLNNN